MTTPSAPTARPSSSYQRLLLGQTTAARLRGGSPAASETGTTPTLRVVPDQPRPRRELTGTPTPAATEAASLRLDDQCRSSARRLLATLGWDAATPLAAYLDRDRGLLWLQSQHGGRPHDTDGADCACERCKQHTARPVELPRQPRPAPAGPTVTAKGELNLIRGLVAAIGAQPGETVIAVARPDLDAVALTAAAPALDRLLGDHPSAAASADEDPTDDDSVTPLTRKELG